MMLRTGEIQTSDQVKIQDQEETDGLMVREVLRNKPSALQKEWARHQSLQAGFAARCLLFVAVAVWAVPPLRDAALFLSGMALVVATALIVLQLFKGDRRSAQKNLLFTWLVAPLACWLMTLLVH